MGKFLMLVSVLIYIFIAVDFWDKRKLKEDIHSESVAASIPTNNVEQVTFPAVPRVYFHTIRFQRIATIPAVLLNDRLYVYGDLTPWGRLVGVQMPIVFMDSVGSYIFGLHETLNPNRLIEDKDKPKSLFGRGAAVSSRS